MLAAVEVASSPSSPCSGSLSLGSTRGSGWLRALVRPLLRATATHWRGRWADGCLRRGLRAPDGLERLAPVYEVTKNSCLNQLTRSKAHRKGPAMEHIAIDLGGAESQICIRSSDGSLVEEKRWPTARLASYLKDRPPSRVILESSAEAFRVADIVRELGHDVRVIPASLAPSLGVGARGVKTDRRDAQVLSQVSTRVDLHSIHIPSHLSRTWKACCTAREALVTSRTQLINTVRGWLRTELLKVRATPSTFPDRVRRVGLERPDGMPEFIEHVLCVIDVLNDRIAAADKQLKELAQQHPVCSRLMTIPGVGPVTSIRFVAAIDDIQRFPDAHSVQAYLGLVPGEHSSSTRQRRTGITKAGPPRVRWTLAQAAWVFRRFNKNDPLAKWAAEVEKRRGKKIAATALARRLAGVMYAMWRDGTRYEPSRLRSLTRAAA